MQPTGLAALEAGKTGGLWDASTSIDALVDPPDLVASLTEAVALAWWQDAAPSYRRNILRWVAAAKRNETRQRRIDIVAAHALRGQKVPHY